MANTLTAIMPKILARGLLSLREQLVMPRLVNGDYSETPSEKGSTIDVPVPTAQAASDVAPANTPPQAPDTAPKTVQVVLNNWKKTNFFLTDKDMGDIDRDQAFLPMQVSEAVRALARVVNQDLYKGHVNVWGYVGTAATTPFASSTAEAPNLRKQLHKQRCPRDNRRCVLNFDAEANALQQAAFANFEQTGDQAVKIEGTLGRKYGIDWYSDDDVVTHVTGTATGTVSINGANNKGANSGQYGYNDQQTISIKTAAASSFAPNQGDVFTVVGDTQTYVFVEAAPGVLGASANGNYIIMPSLVQNHADGDAITLKATHVVNLAFHRDAIAFAMRPLAMSAEEYALGSQILAMTDDQTGIGLRVEVSRQYKQVMWELDLLWGSKLVRPELAARLAG